MYIRGFFVDTELVRRTSKKYQRLILYGSAYIIFWMIGGCANYFVLFPSKERIDAPGAQRRAIDFDGGKLEILTARSGAAINRDPEAYVLRFCGNAERTEWNACRFIGGWSDKPVEMWSVNHPGFGGSSGSARLDHLAPAAIAAYDTLAREAQGKPIFISATSLGTTMALHVARQRPVAGLILRAPPPLRQLILQHHGWWNLWLLATPVAMGVPSEIDSIANAKHVGVPAVFIQIDGDTVVPVKYQQKIVDAYAGPKRVIISHGGDHNSILTPAAMSELAAKMDWLWEKREATANAEK
jgi:alpha-beta hydrolase superfamily lysophospholipase